MGAPGEPEPEPENADDLFADGGPMHIGKEDDEGKEEYKLQLVGPTPERFIHLVTQMKFRIGEGAGEAIYQVGVQDDGTVRGITPEQLSASLATLERMAAELGADTSVIQERDGLEGRVAEVLVRTKPKPGGTTCDIRIAVAGNVDSGKSTLIGVMTGTGQLDNGNGAARSAVFTHRHEMESGRTSAVSQQIMGFSSTGRITNHSDLQRTLSWAEIVSQAAKVITFFDLAGHEKYLKTTVYGMTGNIPDYCMLLLGGNMGVTRMTKEHLGIAVNLALPAFVVVTKIDIAPPHVLEETIATISKILKSNGAGRKMPTIVQSMEDVVVAAKNVVHKRSVPIFLVSNVSGEGLAMLQTFLNLLPTRPHWEKKLNKPAQLQIDESFMITGIGTVVSGTMTAGRIHLTDEVLFGPDSLGNFQKVGLKGIHNKRVAVESAQAGQSCSFAVKKIKRSQVRKGMVLISPKANPKATWTFSAEILILFHSTTVQTNYQPVVHIGTVRQAARIMSMTASVLRTGERALCHFCFMYRPEYIKPGTRLLFREGRTKGVGKIVATNGDGTRPPPMLKERLELERKHQAMAEGRAAGQGQGKAAATNPAAAQQLLSRVAAAAAADQAAKVSVGGAAYKQLEKAAAQAAAAAEAEHDGGHDDDDGDGDDDDDVDEDFAQGGGHWAPEISDKERRQMRNSQARFSRNNTKHRHGDDVANIAAGLAAIAAGLSAEEAAQAKAKKAVTASKEGSTAQATKADSPPRSSSSHSGEDIAPSPSPAATPVKAPPRPASGGVTDGGANAALEAAAAQKKRLKNQRKKASQKRKKQEMRAQQQQRQQQVLAAAATPPQTPERGAR